MEGAEPGGPEGVGEGDAEEVEPEGEGLGAGFAGEEEGGVGALGWCGVGVVEGQHLVNIRGAMAVSLLVWQGEKRVFYV